MLIVVDSFMVHVKMDGMYVSGLILSTYHHQNFSLCADEGRELVEDDMVQV